MAHHMLTFAELYSRSVPDKDWLPTKTSLKFKVGLSIEAPLSHE